MWHDHRGCPTCEDGRPCPEHSADYTEELRERLEKAETALRTADDVSDWRLQMIDALRARAERAAAERDKAIGAIGDEARARVKVEQELAQMVRNIDTWQQPPCPACGAIGLGCSHSDTDGLSCRWVEMVSEAGALRAEVERLTKERDEARSGLKKLADEVEGLLTERAEVSRLHAIEHDIRRELGWKRDHRGLGELVIEEVERLRAILDSITAQVAEWRAIPSGVLPVYGVLLRLESLLGHKPGEVG
jgi:ElaB/YqjD/DUF883 family membrane-anchored ribosome-binding protein